ncbi:MAG: bifunctional phosphoglucose/phosphomannose isomerase [Candidatus Verstraetearchaeota archaeon]|nr:bifunctional phosphoglucose/phosphomannose isomerase [Candidatus Verstraetearchaeota archaeon]
MNEEMYETILNMPEFMEKALRELKLNGEIPPEIDGIAFFGMGGSGIAGRITSEWLNYEWGVNVHSYNEIIIPRNLSRKTLITLVSYSGNTEETLMAAKKAIYEGYKVAVISSGGRLMELAVEKGLPHIKIPKIFSQPRESLPYLFTATIKVLIEAKIIGSEQLNQLDECIKTIYKMREGLRENNVPKMLAERIYGKIISIFTYTPLTPAAIRFKQSLNENSKVIAKIEVIPEACHNAIMEWEEDPEILKKIAMVIIREDNVKEKLIEISMNTLKEIALRKGATMEEIYAIGNNVLSHIFSAIYIGDLVSIELANMKRIDARKINLIDYLKGRIRSSIYM